MLLQMADMMVCINYHCSWGAGGLPSMGSHRVGHD